MTEFRYEIVSNPETFRENRMNAHSDHRYFRPGAWPGCQERSGAGTADQTAAQVRASLIGSWYFAGAKNYACAPKDFMCA